MLPEIVGVHVVPPGYLTDWLRLCDFDSALHLQDNNGHFSNIFFYSAALGVFIFTDIVYNFPSPVPRAVPSHCVEQKAESEAGAAPIIIS